VLLGLAIDDDLIVKSPQGLCLASTGVIDDEGVRDGVPSYDLSSYVTTRVV
jgi:hypothetical protein